jgi:hypothetical protein
VKPFSPACTHAATLFAIVNKLKDRKTAPRQKTEKAYKKENKWKKEWIEKQLRSGLTKNLKNKTKNIGQKHRTKKNLKR